MTDRPRNEVPCGLCRQCCYHEHVFLHPEHGDVVEDYRTTEVIDPATRMVKTVLAKRPDGSCVYLGPSGCTIHDRAPSTCRAFDCKRLYDRLEKIMKPEQLADLTLRSPPLQVGRRRWLGVRP